jgi:hypothetical protein
VVRLEFTPHNAADLRITPQMECVQATTPMRRRRTALMDDRRAVGSMIACEASATLRDRSATAAADRRKPSGGQDAMSPVEKPK